VPPYYVQGLHDYGLWLEQELWRLGGYLVPSPWLISDILIDEEGEEIGLSIPQQRLVMHDETFMEFDIVIGDDLAPTEYSFHFQHIDGPMIWRKDFHEGHFDELGMDTHIHSDPNDPDEREPFELVERTKW
jgi:hypothetical protein